MSPRITRTGTMRADAFAADIFDDRGMVATIVNYTDEPGAAHAMHGQRVRVIAEPASDPEQDAPVDAPPAHGSPLDYLAELKGLLTGLLDAHPSPSEEPTDIAIRRCITLANSASLGILAERKTRP